jgi:hypothetical protein
MLLKEKELRKEIAAELEPTLKKHVESKVRNELK